jgi:hypothetical protein
MYAQSVLAVEEYRQHLRDREARVAAREAVHIRLGNIRLGLALLAAGVAWESLGQHELSAWRMVLPLILFVFVAVYHSHTWRGRD